ncbi:GIY-YIG nuclease family protein [Sphingomonas tagetis]|uniref:GIY-YIG nuclease family protein n=1 Tax=Sphingomonas tagetis TaxID=2949092 RepID=UPI00345F05A0
MDQGPFSWQRGPRSSFALGKEIGIYALFLRKGAALPGIESAPKGLIYIGLAANRNGLRGRCHFDARTRNHSPRKSLTVLLRKQLSLTPTLITKRNSSNTWGLDGPSDARLTAWMHANLELAVEPCLDPHGRETELVGRYAPPLNLTK